ncbi:hypothetical protein CEXT_468331, partial [Caerostris extrusa]
LAFLFFALVSCSLAIIEVHLGHSYHHAPSYGYHGSHYYPSYGYGNGYHGHHGGYGYSSHHPALTIGFGRR